MLKYIFHFNFFIFIILADAISFGVGIMKMNNNEYRNKCIKNLNFEITGCIILLPIATVIIAGVLYLIIPLLHRFPMSLLVQSNLGVFGFGAILGYIFIDKILDISWITDESKKPYMWVIKDIKESAFFVFISMLVGFVGGLIFGIPLYILLEKEIHYLIFMGFLFLGVGWMGFWFGGFIKIKKFIIKYYQQFGESQCSSKN